MHQITTNNPRFNKTFLLRTVTLISILSALLLMVVFAVLRNEAGSDTLFSAVWSLDELQTNFTGSLPEAATDIVYQSKPIYALLSFKAPPQNATEFANRFCSALLYQGYDPFATQDNVSQSIGHLIKTESDYFYYSYSPNTPQTYFGNRCFEYNRGGIDQVLLDKTNPNIYTVKLQISGACNNPKALYPCSGQSINYEAHGSLLLNAKPESIASRYAEGDSWNIAVLPNTKYEIVVTPIDGKDNNYLNLMISTVQSSSVTTPYCEACWVDTRGNIPPGGFRTTFTGSPSGQSEIDIFWMGKSDGIFSVQVNQTKN